MVGEEVEHQVGGVDVLGDVAVPGNVEASRPGVTAARDGIQLDSVGTVAPAICDALYFGTDRLVRGCGPTLCALCPCLHGCLNRGQVDGGTTWECPDPPA